MISPAFAQYSSTKPTQTTSPKTICRTLAVGGADGWEPITYINDNGQHTGLAIDILQNYAERTDLRLDVNLDIPWPRAIQMLRNGELDVIAGAYFTNERDQIHFYSVPFAHDDIMVFQHRDNRFAVSDLHDLIGHRGARPQGGSYGDYIDRFAEQRLDMMFSPTGNRIFDVLMNGRVDYVMLGRFDGLANIYRDKLRDDIKIVEQPVDSNDVRFMFSRKSPCMVHVKQLNLLIEELSEDGTLDFWTHNHLINLSEGES
ncbi:amino acid-binding protein [Thalassospira sp. HJ]|uniref:substrate-binding periplasmic protein n=1 Tax=Thalassospira sp. HJ TaxID=1616823 RepID=UPI0005CDE0E6|nr:transporter substrate-binding domain-containing protein [Thalassospira sp. HJ]KJE34305.1 amino acid-binding protein [Thalassospira sp. HJ]